MSGSVIAKLKNQTFTILDCSPSTTVAEFKHKFYEAVVDVPPNLNRAILNGAVLKDDAPLSTYNLPSPSFVVQIFPLPPTFVPPPAPHITELNSNLSLLLSLTNSTVSKEACLVALHRSNGDVVGAAENIFILQDEVQERRAEDLRAEGYENENENDKVKLSEILEERMMAEFKILKEAATNDNSYSNSNNSVGALYFAKESSPVEAQISLLDEILNQTADADADTDTDTDTDKKIAAITEDLLDASADANADLDEPDDHPHPPPTASSPSLLENLLGSTAAGADRDSNPNLNLDETSLADQSLLSLDSLDSQLSSIGQLPGPPPKIPIHQTMEKKYDFKHITEIKSSCELRVPTSSDLEHHSPNLTTAHNNELSRIKLLVETSLRKERLRCVDVTTKASRTYTNHIRARYSPGSNGLIGLVHVKCFHGVNDCKKLEAALGECEAHAKASFSHFQKNLVSPLGLEGGIGSSGAAPSDLADKNNHNHTFKHKQNIIRKPSNAVGAKRSRSSTVSNHNNSEKYIFDPKTTSSCTAVLGYSLDFDPVDILNETDASDRSLTQTQTPKNPSRPTTPAIEATSSNDMTFAIVTEFCNGDSLESKVLGAGRLAEVDVLRWARQVCTSVEHMTTRKVVHGALRCANVKLTSTWSAAAADPDSPTMSFDASVLNFKHAKATVLNSTKKKKDVKIVLSVPDDNYTPPEVVASNLQSDEVNLASIRIDETTMDSSKIDVWGLGCTFFELVTKKSLKFFDGPMHEMENNDAIKHVPSRYGDVIKHLLRRSLKHDPKQRASVSEITTVLDQRIKALEVMHNPRGKTVVEEKEIRLTKGELLELGRKVKREAKLRRNTDRRRDDDISLVGSISSFDNLSVTTSDSKMKEKLLQQIEEAKKIHTEEGWERTKDRVKRAAQIHWWNCLSDYDRRIFLHKKECRRVHGVHVSRRKLSRKAALMPWWGSSFLGEYFGYIFKKLEEEGVIGKIKDNLLQLKLDELNARMYRPKNDDESSTADTNSVSKFSEKDDESVGSMQLSKKINLTSLENGLLDKRLDGFNVGVPVYAPIPPAMEVANGEYFVMSKINPLFEQLRREEERRKKDVEMGLLTEDGTESEAQAALRVKKKAKMGWKGAGMKVKMAVALNADVKKMKVGTEKSFEEELRRREKELNLENQRGEIDHGKEVSCWLLGCDYSVALAEAMEWGRLTGLKLINIIEECDEKAEEVMERMRDQSILTDASQQILVKNNNVARFVSKDPRIMAILERAVRTAEMPAIAGHDDPTKWDALTRIQSVSQLRRDDVTEDGKMKFTKLEMLGQTTILSFCLQRSYVRLSEILLEGQFNACSLMQARWRGKSVRRVVEIVRLEAARQTALKIKEEDYAQRKAEIDALRRKLTPPLIPTVSHVHATSLMLEMPGVICDLGKWGHFGYYLDSHVRNGSSNSGDPNPRGDITVLMSVANRKIMGDKRGTKIKFLRKAEEKGGGTGVGMDMSDERIIVKGLKPNSSYRVYLRIMPTCREAMVAAMQKHHTEGIADIRAARMLTLEKAAGRARDEAQTKSKKTLKKPNPLLGVDVDVGDEEASLRIEESGKRAYDAVIEQGIEEVADEEDHNLPLFLKLGHYIKKLAEGGGGDGDHLEMWKEVVTKADRPSVCEGVEGGASWVLKVDEYGGGSNSNLEGSEGAWREKSQRIIKVGEFLSKGMLNVAKEGISVKTEKIPRVSLKWNEPANNGHGISKYVVWKRRVEVGGVSVDVGGKDIYHSATATQFVDVLEDEDETKGDCGTTFGLVPVVYEYKVAAVNMIGQGDWSAAGVRVKVERAREVVVVENNDNGEEKKEREVAENKAGGGAGGGAFPVLFAPAPIFLGGGRGDESGRGPSTREAASNMSINSNVMLAASPALVIDFSKLRRTGKKKKVQRK